MLAQDLIAWTKQRVRLAEQARSWQLKRLRYRLLHQSGRIARHARRIDPAPRARLAMVSTARRRVRTPASAPSSDWLTAGALGAPPTTTTTSTTAGISLPANNPEAPPGTPITPTNQPDGAPRSLHHYRAGPSAPARRPMSRSLQAARIRRLLQDRG